jgi:hypothetical protein
LKTRAQVIAPTRRGNARIAQIDKLLNTAATDDPLAEFVNAADTVKAVAGLSLGSLRVVIDRLCTVTILPAEGRDRGFDPAASWSSPNTTWGYPRRPTTGTGGPPELDHSLPQSRGGMEAKARVQVCSSVTRAMSR